MYCTPHMPHGAAPGIHVVSALFVRKAIAMEGMGVKELLCNMRVQSGFACWPCATKAHKSLIGPAALLETTRADSLPGSAADGATVFDCEAHWQRLYVWSLRSNEVDSRVFSACTQRANA